MKRSARRIAGAGLALALFTLQLPIAYADMTVGPSSVDTGDGDRIGRIGLNAFAGALTPTLTIDPELDSLAREQLRVAIAGSADSGNLGPRLIHAAPATLVRIGLVSTAALDGKADLFPLTGPAGATAFGSAGGEVQLNATAGGQSPFVAQVAAMAWRDSRVADAPDELTATFGTPPRTQDELNEAAAQRWVDQENRDRQSSNFPTDLLARRHPVLDREAENTMRRRFGEEVLPPLVDPTGQVSLDNKTHFTAYACSPNCDPFWTVPDRFVDVYRQPSVEDVAAQSVARPELLDFQRYTSQLTWAVQLPRYPHYWNSYRTFGIATRVHLDQEVAEHRDAVRSTVEALAAGGADVWDPREYKLDIVVIAYDPWPTDWHIRP
jgi:hypothetical protein